MDSQDRDQPCIAIDAHVHLWECHSVASVLNAALVNLSVATRSQADGLSGIVLLAELGAGKQFARLCEGGGYPPATGWSFQELGDSYSLLARKETGEALLVIAGRQIVTSEKLEVLAFGTNRPVPDGRTAFDTIAAIARKGALPILPWGVGKWLGQRGRTVRRLLPVLEANGGILGDIAGRPTLWHEPGLFREGKQLGLRILCGSDPLPLIGRERVVGTYASRLHARLDLRRNTTQALLSRLQDKSITLESFGRRCGSVGFVTDQFALRRPMVNNTGGVLPARD